VFDSARRGVGQFGKLDALVGYAINYYRDFVAPTKKFREPPPLSDQPSKALDFITLQLSKLNWPKASVILGGVAGLIILIVAGIAWLHRGTQDPLANLAPGTYQPAKSGETLPLPPASNHH